MSDYYDGVKLLSMKDINGNTPEIFVCSGNNTAGKTTYFSRLLVNRFLDGNGKFMLIYRFRYELDDCADKFFKDIGSLFFPGKQMTSRQKAKGVYHELYLNDVSCGYVVALNSVDVLKKYAHFFNDTNRMFMDEFQSETNHYCPDEVIKFRALHKLVARGQSKMVRYVPVYMCSNPITVLNPYYIAWGFSNRITKETKFLRGDGVVLEQVYNVAASNAQQSSAFNRAFGNDKYAQFTNNGTYLSDNNTFIEKPTGNGRYLATILFNGINYAIREYSAVGYIYCDKNADLTFPNKIAATTEDHQINYVMLKSNDLFLDQLRFYFERGCFRFRDLQCKEAILNILSF